MSDLPSYSSVTQDIELFEKHKQFALRMPKECPCTRKALYDIWKGEVMNYHLMKCVRCGVSQIWPVDKHTGVVLMDSDFNSIEKVYLTL